MAGTNPSNPSGGGGGSVTFDPLLGRIVLDRYEILKRIGSGGMGAVYMGRQLAVGRKIALKVLRMDLMTNEHVRHRFRREAEIIAKLKHPHTIQLIDFGETEDGLSVMVMELLEGLPLSDRLKEGPLPLEDTLRLGEEVAGSLGEAHTYGLVHRDLKPANIFLAEAAGEVRAKVLDFGIARLLDEEATRLTSTGQVFGTPRYMSPEQAMSTGDVDTRSDLYSLGLILYECVVGQPPFVAQTSIQYLSAHTTQAPPKLRERAPDAPPPLEELIDACLSKDPEARPQSAREVAEVLMRIRRSLEVGDPTAPIVVPRGPGSALTRPDATRPSVPPSAPGPGTWAPPPQPTSPPSSGRLGLAVLGVILAVGAVALAGGAMYWARPDQPVPMTDAGSWVVAAVEVPDAGFEAVALAEPDAGEAEDDAGELDALPPDVGEVEAQDDPPPTKKKKKKKKGPSRASDATDPPVGTGVVTGPRGLVLNLGDEEEVDLFELAAKCKTSSYSGLSKLSTRGCPDGCAIIVDEQCAGLTPAQDRALPPGRRNVTIVCEGRVRTTAVTRFMSGETTTFTCR